jgi:hypothetical protein
MPDAVRVCFGSRPSAESGDGAPTPAWGLRLPLQQLSRRLLLIIAHLLPYSHPRDPIPKHGCYGNSVHRRRATETRAASKLRPRSGESMMTESSPTVGLMGCTGFLMPGRWGPKGRVAMADWRWWRLGRAEKLRFAREGVPLLDEECWRWRLRRCWSLRRGVHVRRVLRPGVVARLRAPDVHKRRVVTPCAVVVHADDTISRSKGSGRSTAGARSFDMLACMFLALCFGNFCRASEAEAHWLRGTRARGGKQ